MKREKLKTLWPYNKNDETTWPWIDCVICGELNRLRVSRWIPNPEFRYGHLMKEKR